MRVAHIITRMIIGGAQENTLYNCLDLVAEHGDDVLLLTGPTEGPEGKLLEQGRAGGLPVVYVDALKRPIHPVGDWRAYRQLKQQILRWKPDVVHTHSAKGGFLGRWVASRCRIPVIVHSVHGAPFHDYQSRMVRRFFILLERWAARHCHHFISVADAMTELMVGAGVAPREKFTTIYSGMDVEPFRTANATRAKARKELGFPDEAVVIGKIARLYHLKGHAYVVAAAERVIRENPLVRFLLVGDGILRSQLERQIAERGLSEYFVFSGLVPPEKIPYYLGAMDMLVHTSLREGLARTLPQALIAGKPVISYDIDGAREVTITGETGVLLPPQSIDELAAAMLRLAGNADERRRMGQGGADRFTDQFDHRQMTAQIRQLYLQLGAK